MQVTAFKENGWKYTHAEKLEIVFIGMSGVVKNVCRNFHISTPTYYRWKAKYLLNASRIFRKNNSQKTPTAHQETSSIEIAAKCKLLSMVPSDLVGSLKASDEYKSFLVQTVKTSKYASIKSVCKSIGFSANTYYKNKNKELGCLIRCN